jgi:hypothetical protein
MKRTTRDNLERAIAIEWLKENEIVKTNFVRIMKEIAER